MAIAITRRSGVEMARSSRRQMRIDLLPCTDSSTSTEGTERLSQSTLISPIIMSPHNRRTMPCARTSVWRALLKFRGHLVDSYHYLSMIINCDRMQSTDVIRITAYVVMNSGGFSGTIDSTHISMEIFKVWYDHLSIKCIRSRFY
jgi:hypothetical protein